MSDFRPAGARLADPKADDREAAEGDSVIEIDRLTVHYNVEPVLDDVSLTIGAGTVAAIIGPNASGKTTLLETMAGLISPIEGTVRVFGLPRRESVENELLIRRRVCYLPMAPLGLDDLTVRKTWLAMAELYGRDMRAAFEQVTRLAAAFDLTESLDADVASLSTGQRRKVNIAAVLMTDAELLLLDEPFSGGLDPAGIRALKAILRHLSKSRGRTIVFTIPVPELVDGVADQVIVIGGQGIIIDATPADVVARAGTARTLSDAIAQLAFPENAATVAAYLDADDGQHESNRDGGR